MTVMTDVALGELAVSLIPAPAATLRPMLVVSAGGMNLATFHAPSGNPNAARGVLGAQLSLLATLPGNGFIAMGDANSDITLQTNAVVSAHAPDGATHQGGGSLDGAVCSPHIAATVSNVGMKAGDHCGIQGRFT